MMNKTSLPFSVGYPCHSDISFFNMVSPYLVAIGEVYFSTDSFAAGRATHGFSYNKGQTEADLLRFRQEGIRLNLLLNGNCYGGETLSQNFAFRVCKEVERLLKDIGLDAVTTASPFVAHALKKNFPFLDVRASVNMWVDGINGMEQCADIFDSFYLKRDYNYCIQEIEREHTWCEQNGKKLYLLANSGCIPNCSYHIFHDNFISHSKEVAVSSKDQSFEPYACRRMIMKEENRHMILSGNLVRPEDVYRYDGLVDGIKLATRIHPYPSIVIGAYARGFCPGDVSDLTEPGFGDILAPQKLDNTAIPEDYWAQRTNCARAMLRGNPDACQDCGYCRELYKNILFSPEN